MHCRRFCNIGDERDTKHTATAAAEAAGKSQNTCFVLSSLDLSPQKIWSCDWLWSFCTMKKVIFLQKFYPWQIWICDILREKSKTNQREILPIANLRSEASTYSDQSLHQSSIHPFQSLLLLLLLLQRRVIFNKQRRRLQLSLSEVGVIE